jgi:hypothetical protein
VCMTQSNTKQLPTCLDPHILVPSVIPFCIDMRAESLSDFVALHPLLNIAVNHQMIEGSRSKLLQLGSLDNLLEIS